MVTNDFSPRVGGANTYVTQLMRRLSGDEVTVFASDWPGASAFDVGYPHEVIRWPSRTMHPTVAVRHEIERLIRGLRPDVLLFGAAVPLAIMGKTVERRTGVPYATFTHGVEFWAGQLPVARELLHSATTNAALTMGVSRWAVERLREVIGPEPRVELLIPGIDAVRLHPDVSDAPVRERHALDDRPVICCVARLIPRKGQDQLIRALPRIAVALPEARLLIVGSGPDRPRLEGLARRKQVEDRVIFTGEVGPDDIPSYLRTGDVFAMPNRSRWFGLEVEAFGIVFLEAAAVGRPSLAGCSGGAPEAVVHGQTGLVVDGHDIGEVAAGITELLADSGKAVRLGTTGAQRARHHFTWEASACRLRRLLVDALVRG